MNNETQVQILLERLSATVACQDDDYYLRKAAKLINEKSINA